MIKVLIIAGSMHVGGIENQLMHLLRNADKKCFQIDFTSTMEEAFYRNEIESFGSKFILIPNMDWKRPWKYCRALIKVMQDGEYDIVHSHELFHSGITLWLAKRAGIPCRFAHAHNWRDDDGSGKRVSAMRKLYNAIMRILIRRYSTVQIACSTFAGEFLYGKDILKRQGYHLVYNSVDTSKFVERYDRQEKGEFCDSGWVNVLHVGRVTMVKNQTFLVKMAEWFRVRDERIRILCAGNGDREYMNRIQKEITDKGLDEYIRLLGVRRDIDMLMRKASAFVLPSQYEGMPLVLIEAQASGLPCVVADTFSHEVDFGIGTVEWLPLDGNVDAWCGAVKTAIQKERAPKEQVVEAIKRNRFDAKMFAETICKLYQEDYVRERGQK